jgi:hypothetical protein
MSSSLEQLRSAYAIRGHTRATRAEVVIVTSIPSETSGKYRPARSFVTSSYDGVTIPDMPMALSPAVTK